MSELPDPKPDLEDATNTDEVYALAYKLTAWGLRNGECDEYDALDWALSHPHEAKLPRGSKGRPNPTAYHIGSGVRNAVESYDPERVGAFDPEPVHALAARVSGSGVTHERYLLGVLALCFEYKTLTPVVTGPNLARVVGVAEPTAGEVIREWSRTHAYGFFTDISYDGVGGHGRVWTVDPGWEPVSKPKHRPGCNRSKARCSCPGLSQSALSIFTAVKDRSAKVRQFEKWVADQKPRTPITVSDVCRMTGLSRKAATDLLRSHQGGGLLDEGTWPGGRRRRRENGKWRWVNQGETWFVA
jgi:hypothetical protein